MNGAADTLILVLVYATVAQAWSWLGAYAGILSFGHAVFFGIGAYAVAVSNLRGGSPWYGALGGALFAVLVAALFGALFLRGQRYIFAGATLIAGACAELFVAGQRWVGPANAFAFPIRHGFLNLQFAQKWPYLLLALMVFAVTQALTFGLRSTRIGYYLRALRSNSRAARSIGIGGRPWRLLVLVASAFVTSVAGSFFAEYTMGVDAHVMFALALSLDIALIGIVAGTASLWTAPLVALIYVLVAKAIAVHPAGVGGVISLVLEALLVVFVGRAFPAGLLALRRPRSPRPAIAA